MGTDGPTEATVVAVDWGHSYEFCRHTGRGRMFVEVPSSAASRLPVITGGVGSSRFARTPLVTFFVLAYGFSWAWVIPWTVTGHTVVQGVGWPTHFPVCSALWRPPWW